jgi:hypothetical protein
MNEQKSVHADLISPGAGLDEGTALDVMGPADLAEGMELFLRFTQGPSRSGQVIRIEDYGTRAVIEVDGGQWWLHRRDEVRTGPVISFAWAVGGQEQS